MISIAPHTIVNIATLLAKRPLTPRDKPTVFIFIGIPCSGKSTEAKRWGIRTISCDEIRKELSPTGTYDFNSEREKEVWDTFYKRLKTFKWDFIIDNTSCKQKYIHQILANIPPQFAVQYVIFEIPLWKAKLRNIIRWMKTGKWIPNDVMNNMHRNFEILKKNYPPNENTTYIK